MLEIDTTDLDEGPDDQGQERWCHLDDMYAISDYGRLWANFFPETVAWDHIELLTLNGRLGVIKRQFTDRDRYLHVGIRDKKVLVHRLVALAFVANPMAYPFVLHNDGNPRHNHFRNLRWGNAKMNTLDAQKHGTYRNPGGRKSGESYDVNHLYALVDQGTPNKQIARLLGIAPSTVRYRIRIRSRPSRI